MKHSIFAFVFLLLVQFVSAQTEVEENSTKESQVFTIVETMPSWIGCETQKYEEKRVRCTIEKLMEFIAENLIYPTESMKKNIQGTVYVTFVINPEGKVIEPKILRGVNEEMDEEALRIIHLMPQWNPGKQRGKPVAVQYNLPVKYTK